MNDPLNRWYGAIARNKQGLLGIVLGWAYDHSNDGKQFKFHGIGIRGGKWRSHEQPEWVAGSIDDYARRQAEIQRYYKNRLL